MPSISKRGENGLTDKSGGLNGAGAVVIAVCVVVGVMVVGFIVWIIVRRVRRQREGKRAYSVHHTKNNSDTGHLLAQTPSWLPDAHKDGLPTFTASYRADAPPIFHFPAQTFAPASSISSTARYSQLKHSGMEDSEEHDRRHSFASTLTPRPPSTVLMLEESAVPFMREVTRAPSHSPKSLPPLSIPRVDAVSTSSYTSVHPVAVMDTPITSAVSSATSESIYSQASATTSRAPPAPSPSPSPPPIPSIPTLIPRTLPAIPDDVLRRVAQTELPGADLNRAPTKVIATLVKKRAHGAELNRNGTAVSRIERSDSITSFDGPGEDEVVEFHPVTGRRRMKTTRRKWEAARAKQREAEMVDVPMSATETRHDTTLDS